MAGGGPAGLKENLTVLMTATAKLASREWKRSPQLPVASSAGWHPGVLSGAETHLYDPSEVLASALMQRLIAAGPAGSASLKCATPEDCPEAEAFLDVKVSEIAVNVGRQASGESVIQVADFRADLALVSPEGRSLWSTRCDVPEPVTGRRPAEQFSALAQALLDVVAVRCAEQASTSLGL